MEAKHTPAEKFILEQYGDFLSLEPDDISGLMTDFSNQENQKLKQEKEELVEMLEEAEQLFTEIRRSLSLHPDCVENSEFQDLAYGSQEMEEKILSLIQKHKKGGEE